MTNLRLDDRSPLHPANNVSTSMSVPNNVSAAQQQVHRVGGNQAPPQQQHPQQQRGLRAGLVQRGKKNTINIKNEIDIDNLKNDYLKDFYGNKIHICT